MKRLTDRQVRVLSAIGSGGGIMCRDRSVSGGAPDKVFTSSLDGLSAPLYLTMTMRALERRGLVKCEHGALVTLTESGRGAVNDTERTNICWQ